MERADPREERMRLRQGVAVMEELVQRLIPLDHAARRHDVRPSREGVEHPAVENFQRLQQI